MRYLELSITQPPEQRHPMHQFVVSHTEYGITRLLYRQPYTEAEHAALFHVKGPVATYRTQLTEMSTILEFEIAPCADDSFYLYIRERLSEYEQEFTNAFSQP